MRHKGSFKGFICLFFSFDFYLVKSQFQRAHLSILLAFDDDREIYHMNCTAPVCKKEKKRIG